jgi:hypothetical protein
VTEPGTDLKRRALLAGITGAALAAMGALALRLRPGRRKCGSQGSGGAPAAMWPGYSDSTSLLFSWWPPATGPAPDTYNVYRDGNRKAIATGLKPHPTIGGGPQAPVVPVPFFIDRNLAAGSTHAYYVTGVTAGVESVPGPTISMTTLPGPTTGAGSTPTPMPAAAADPATWIQSYALPAGGTLWTVTNTANNTAAGGGPRGNAGCGLQHAFSNFAPGDIIVLSAGLAFQSEGTFSIPAFVNPNNLWTYIISSEDPVYKAGGALPGYSYSTNFFYTQFSCSAPIPAGATTATLSTGNWTSKTGAYPTIFRIAATGKIEQRLVTFTHGSPTISWANYNGPSPGLVNSCNATILSVVLNAVTPTDMAAMPTINLAGNTGLLLPAGASYIRCVGIRFHPNAPSLSVEQSGSAVQFATSAYGSLQQSANHVYFDRCLIGDDSGNLGTTYSYLRHGIFANCDHFLVNQCFFWGICSCGGWSDPHNPGQNRPGGDAMCVLATGGGWHCVQNCYLEGGAESIIYGGAFVDKTQIPHDIVARYNYSTKPLAWMTTAIGCGVKNHFELKVGVRAEYYGNTLQNCWHSIVGIGQNGRAFVFGARDQVAATPKNPILSCTPWVKVTDVNAHDNQCWDVGELCVMFSSDHNPACYTARIRFANNVCFMNPGIDNTGTKTIAEGVVAVGPVAEVILDHNTIIYNSANPNWDPATYYLPRRAIANQAARGYLNPQPQTPNGIPRALDRWTVTNNVLDLSAAICGDLLSGTGSTMLNACLSNYTWGSNLLINDTGRYPAPSYNPVPYASVGFAKWQGNGTQPNSANDWNVTSGNYAKASTTGGPLGAAFS